MKKRVLVKDLIISIRGERQQFQINLPRDAENITGVYCSLVLGSSTAGFPTARVPLFYNRTTVIGDIRLQTLEKAGWFYASQVTTEDLNIAFVDPSLIVPLFVAKPFTHSVNNFRFESVLASARESTVINGYFKDNIGSEVGADTLYRVRIYVEVELKNCKQ